MLTGATAVAADCAAYGGRMAQYFFLLLFPHSPQPIRTRDPLFPFNINKDFGFNFYCRTHLFLSQDKKKVSSHLYFLILWVLLTFGFFLSFQADSFQRTSTRVARKYWWKNIKMMIIIGVIVLIVIILIIVFATNVI